MVLKFYSAQKTSFLYCAQKTSYFIDSSKYLGIYSLRYHLGDNRSANISELLQILEDKKSLVEKKEVYGKLIQVWLYGVKMHLFSVEVPMKHWGDSNSFQCFWYIIDEQ